MPTLQDIMNKRPSAKIEKLYPGVTQKQLADLTIRDLNNIAAHIMVEDGRPLGSNLNPISTAMEIISQWTRQKNFTLI